MGLFFWCYNFFDKNVTLYTCPKKLATLPFVYLSANMDTIFCAIKIVLRLEFLTQWLEN